MHEIAGNPLLLMLMAIVGRDRPLPRNRRRLYAHVTDVLISEWDVTKQLRESHGDVPPLDPQAKLRLLRHLAFWMQCRESGPAGNYIEADELSRIFRDHLVEFYGFENERAHAMAYSMIDKLRQRSFILERYGLRLFGFVHRTFLEYFCAEEIVDRFDHDPDTWGIDQLRALFRENWADPSWREVLRLVAGALPAEVANDLVTLLATQVNRPWPPLNLAGPPWNLVLAAQCVAEAPQPAGLAGAGEAVLRQVVLLVEHGISADDPNVVEVTEQELLPSIRALGPQWPGRPSSCTGTAAAGCVPAGSPDRPSRPGRRRCCPRPTSNWRRCWSGNSGRPASGRRASRWSPGWPRLPGGWTAPPAAAGTARSCCSHKPRRKARPRCARRPYAPWSPTSARAAICSWCCATSPPLPTRRSGLSPCSPSADGPS